MDAFIKRVVADFGVDQPTVEKALGIILDFLAKEGPADKVQPLLAKLPGGQALMQKAASDGDAGMGGVMGAGMRMMAAGLEHGASAETSPGNSSPTRARKSVRTRSADWSALFPAWRSLFEQERA